MIENVSTQLTVFHCFAHCLLPGRAFASLYALLFLEKEAEIGGRDYIVHVTGKKKSVNLIWVKAFRTIPEIRSLRPTFHRKSALKC